MGRRKRAMSEDDRAKALERLREVRDQQAELKKEGEDLKEDLLPFIQDLGTFLYEDEHGNKRVAYYSDSEMTVLDIDELIACVEEGLVTESVLELVAPRTQDAAALKRAMQSKRMSREVIRRCVRLEHTRQTIRFKEEGEDG